MKRLLREPLLHFLLLGALIFGVYVRVDGEAPADEILVTRGQQLNLIDTFERTWRRPPTAAEFRGLVDDYVRQELAYREAAAMGLDRNDIVIRRRLRQKLELLTEDIASLTPPTDRELDAYLADNAEQFRMDARFSFEQIFVSADRRGSRAEEDARALLVGILSSDSNVDVQTHGDPIALLPARMDAAGETEIANLFGADFAEQLAEVAPGIWSGPLRSGYGWHLVRVTDRQQSRVPKLDEVAERVANEVLAQRRKAALDALYERLGEDYTIRIEPLQTTESLAVHDATGSAPSASE